MTAARAEIIIDRTKRAPRIPPPNDDWAMFNVDPLLVERFVRYHSKYRFACAVETGTFKGHTTVGLARLIPKVFTVEIDPVLHEQVQPRFSCYPNITSLLGNSPDVLKKIQPQLAYPLFAYLDAHWEGYWPLRDELRLLFALKQPQLIMIHDFRVPGRDFGFDSYQGSACDLDFLGDILPHGVCRYAFNDRTAAQSANRGVLFIEHMLD